MSGRKVQSVLHKLRKELTVALGDDLDAVILYGSQARATATGDSDIDVLILVRDDRNYADLMRRTSATVAALSLEHDVVISRVFMSRQRFEQEQSPFLMNVRREGVPV